jgi:hypothetical protein
VERTLHKIAETLYKTGQPAGGEQAGAAGAGAGPAGAGPGDGQPGGGPGPDKKKDDVIDAEYVDVDETKRPN